MQRDRIERKEIAIGTVRNYAKAIKLFYEMADLTVAWQKIMRGFPRRQQHMEKLLLWMLQLLWLLSLW